MATMTMDYTVSRRQHDPVRLTARGRLVVRLCVAALVAFVGYTVLGLVAGAAVSASDDVRARAVHSVVVREGETLWQIARRELPGVDVRDAVAMIRVRNGLPTGAVILAGQTLDIPRG